jgi:hypothetical protein
MAKITPARRMFVMAAVGVCAALLSADAAAQDLPTPDSGKLRLLPQGPRTAQALRLELVPLPELVLLPEPLPLPAQVPPPEPTPPPAPVPAPELVAPPQLAPPVEQARPEKLAWPSEPVLPSEQTPIRQALPPDLAPIQIPTGQWSDIPPSDPTINPKDHPAVGSWFGKAIQLCQQGVAPSACAGGQPANALFMTPTLTADGLFLGNDSFALLPAPFGPHTTAHGSWAPISATEFSAEYVFMTPTFPPVANNVTGYRFRWFAQVINADTAVGYVNLYTLPNVPLTWTPLGPDEFPYFPPEAYPFVTPPTGIVKDPTTCWTTGCPLVFKFTIKRVTR